MRRSGDGARAPEMKPQIVAPAPYAKNGSGSSHSRREVLLAAAAFGAASPAPVPETVEQPVQEPHQTGPKIRPHVSPICQER